MSILISLPCANPTTVQLLVLLFPLNIISLILIIISYIIFAYLTYNPIKTELFFDTQEEKYGINSYFI